MTASFLRLAKQSLFVSVASCVVLIQSAASVAQVGFHEESVSRGVVYSVALTAPHNPFGAGLALVDLDGDRDPDLVAVGKSDGKVGLWENDGTGFFTGRSSTSGLPTVLNYSGISAADYDGDGDLDLYLTQVAAANYLMRNNGNFTFTRVLIGTRIEDSGAGMGSAWGDVNGDEHLDMYLSNRTQNIGGITSPNQFFISNGDGTFTETGETLGVGHSDDPTFLTSLLDYDLDGDLDLYICNDKGISIPSIQNYMYRNDSTGQFTDATVATGTGAHIDCMGIAFGDWTRNGAPDIYITNTPSGNILYLNQGGGSYVDSTLLADVGSYNIGWSTQFFDFDNDGWDELYACDSMSTNRLYNYDGTWPATDIAGPKAVDDSSSSFCSATGDIDNDGDLDLVVSSLGQNLRLFVNLEGQTKNWVKYHLVGSGANTFAVGARLELRTGSDWQMRQIRAGTNYKSQNDYAVHFGLDQATQVDELRITWPGGTQTTFEDLPINTASTIYQDNGQAIPTVSVWGVLAMACLLFTGGTILLRRQQSAFPSHGQR